jgi:hypothetical protein
VAAILTWRACGEWKSDLLKVRLLRWANCSSRFYKKHRKQGRAGFFMIVAKPRETCTMLLSRGGTLIMAS